MYAIRSYYVYRREPALHESDFAPAGFEWVDCNDAEQSTLTFLRKGQSTDDVILVVCNFTPVPRQNYRVGVPRGGYWREVLNSDARQYGGSGQGNIGGADAAPISAHGRPYTLTIVVPPLATVFFNVITSYSIHYTKLYDGSLLVRSRIRVGYRYANLFVGL